jgi:hypothetical protein
MENQITTEPSWHGTEDERLDLLYAIAHNCDCAVDSMGVQLEACASHHMLINDQRALDGLLFGRHMVDYLKRQEFELNEHQPAVLPARTSL